MGELNTQLAASKPLNEAAETCQRIRKWIT